MPDAVRPSLQPVGRRDPRGAMPAASGAALRKRRAMGGDAIVATALLDRPRDPRNSQGDPRGGRLWRVGAAIRPCSIATRAGAFEGPGSARASGSEKLPAARKPVKDKEIPWSPENKGLPETSKEFKRLQRDFERLPKTSKNFQKFPKVSAGLRARATRRHGGPIAAMGSAAPFGFVLSLPLAGSFERPTSKGGSGVPNLRSFARIPLISWNRQKKTSPVRQRNSRALAAKSAPGSTAGAGLSGRRRAA